MKTYKIKRTVLLAIIIIAAMVILSGCHAAIYGIVSGGASDDVHQEQTELADRETENPLSGQDTETGDTVPGSQNNGRTSVTGYTIVDTNGNNVSLSDFLGKPVVINFWASWCPPCRSEMPDFNTVYEELGDDVHFVMVCLVDGERETVESGEAFISENGFSFPIYFDFSQDAPIFAYVTALPTTLFVDVDGFIEARAEGAIDEETLRLGISYIWG